MKKHSSVSKHYRVWARSFAALALIFGASAYAVPDTKPSPATIVNGIVEKFTDKLLNMRLYNQQLDSNATAKMEFNDVVIANHALFCSQNGALAGQDCSQSDSELENADIQISSLLGLPVIPDSEGTSLDLAARVFSRNMVSSSKSKFNTFQFSEVQGPTKDKDKADEYATGLLNASILSIPAFSYGEMYGNRKLGAGYQDIQKPDAEPTSLMNYLSQVSGRMLDQKWVEDVTKTTDALVLQRKQIFMQAEQLLMDYQRLKQGERIEALLSAIVVQNERQREASAEIFAHAKPPPSTPTTIPNFQSNP
jgi:hypothetical protein